MDSNYLDFGVDSDSDGDDDGKMECVAEDSEEEDAIEAAALLKMMTTKIPMPHSKTKKQRDVEDFQAEMEMELNRRAKAVETEGGVEHQRSLSRSSSTSSLKASPSTSSKANNTGQSSSHGRPSKSSRKATPNEGVAPTGRKNVRFVEETAPAESKKVPKDKVKEMYDEIYFDSDDDEELPGEGETKEQKKNRRKFLSNDDLFYDPAADDKDQNWVDRERNAYFSKETPNQSKKGNPQGQGDKSAETPGPMPLPNSDAVLNCPACFTLLCLDCQRHEFYENQFRAMFVRNCITNSNENRYVPSKVERHSKRKRKVDGNLTEIETTPTSTSFQTDSSDTFNPVFCRVCNTEVAVFDSEEVYHFFNVLTSHC